MLLADAFGNVTWGGILVGLAIAALMVFIARR
jgi:hypothetical protein